MTCSLTLAVRVTCCIANAFARSHWSSNVAQDSPERFKAHTMQTRGKLSETLEKTLGKPLRNPLGNPWKQRSRVLTWHHQPSCKLKLLAIRHTSPMVHLHLQPGTELLSKSWCIDHGLQINQCKVLWSQYDLLTYSRLCCAWGATLAVDVQQQFTTAGSNGNCGAWTRQNVTSEILSFRVLAVTALSVERTVCCETADAAPCLLHYIYTSVVQHVWSHN